MALLVVQSNSKVSHLAQKAMNKEAVSDDKLSHTEENAHDKSHGSSLAAPFKKGGTMTVSLLAITLFISAYISTQWCNTVSCSSQLHSRDHNAPFLFFRLNQCLWTYIVSLFLILPIFSSLFSQDITLGNLGALAFQ